jgi:hypothetical protein
LLGAFANLKQLKGRPAFLIERDDLAIQDNLLDGNFSTASAFIGSMKDGRLALIGFMGASIRVWQSASPGDSLPSLGGARGCYC